MKDQASTRRIAFRSVSAVTIAFAIFISVEKLVGQKTDIPKSVASASKPATGPMLTREVLRTTPRVSTGLVDRLGNPVSVSCASCHANLEPNLDARNGEQLTQFHQGLTFVHGKLTCLTCHNAKNYNLLRLPSEQPLDFVQTQALCGQCHSKQNNDYVRGAHGGMNGHWSLAHGTRVRKRCIDCHDPHAPAFPAMVRTFKSRDRFLKDHSENHTSSAHE